MTSLQIRIRRCCAQAAIDAHCQCADGSAAPDEALIDLLTDLHHWCHGNGLDFDYAFDHARFHFEAEVKP